VPETWDDLARREYAKPEEPVSARASDLTKIGAPVAAFIAAALAAIGGWVADAPRGHTVIAVAAVVAVAVGGLFYVFAADFRSRAAVAVARFNNLSLRAQGEVKANEAVQSEARARVEAAKTEADKARAAADARAAEATKRFDEANDQVARVTAELIETRERLRRYTEERNPPGPEAPPPPSFLALRGADVKARGTRTKVYGIESAGGKVVRYLVRGSDGLLRWVTEAEVEGDGPSSQV
jgi:hypothetical protein